MPPPINETPINRLPTSSTNSELITSFLKVKSDNVSYYTDHIHTKYTYRTTMVKEEQGQYIAEPKETLYEFQTVIKPSKLGLMLVGWGGNNGSTVTGSILANKLDLTWSTKDNKKKANYYGSLMLSSTTNLGKSSNGNEVYIPMNKLLPMINPNDITISGWDINNANLSDAMKRAKVLDYDLQKQLMPHLEKLTPLPSIYYPDFIAANQNQRANNILTGSKMDNLNQIRSDIKAFKVQNDLDLVIVLWTANTERFSNIIEGINDTTNNLMKSIEQGHPEVSPSTIFALASILESSPFINGSPQNTFVPGIIELANKHQVYIAGDDFKSGQTKLKSVLVDFLVNAGIKPLAITSYNHLGNNDGLNLDEQKQFRSKEISKSNVVDDMVYANHLLYKKGEKPDHTVVIKYVPTVGDSKRAIDEYISEIFMGGLSTISIYNTCEDSLLATPLIIDLVLLTELMTRISYKTMDMSRFAPFNSVLSILAYMLKAPMVPNGTQVVNALSKQRSAIENVLRACIGLDPINDMDLKQRTFI